MSPLDLTRRSSAAGVAACLVLALSATGIPAAGAHAKPARHQHRHSGKRLIVRPASVAVVPNSFVAPLPNGTRLFSPTSFWNASLGSKTAIASNSSALVAALNTEVQKEVTDKKGPWINTNQWSVAAYTVGSSVRRVRVQLDQNKPKLQADFASVPIPAGAQPAGGGDHSMTVYQPSTDTLWEFWLASQQADGWHARYGGKMTGVSKNPGYFPADAGASATSLPLLGGLITINELKSGQINHALALAVPNTASSFTWPAQRGDGKTAGLGAVPEGTRFRIDPSVDVTKLGLSPTGLAIAKAAQRYGIIVRDTAGTVTFFAEDPVAIGGDPYGPIWHGAYPSKLLAGFPWQSLKVVAPGG